MIKPIPGWEGYAACDDGRILSFKARVIVPFAGSRIELVEDPIELRTFDRKRLDLSPSPYLSVCLSERGRRRNCYVHELVLLTFRGPRPPGFEACHGPGGSRDNRLANLRWDTPQANTADRVRDAYARRRAS